MRYSGLPRLSLVVVDIPIGLSEKGYRQADVAARKFLKGRACCVFTAPIRPILDCRNHRQALAILRERGEKGCSAQAWGIVGKVREVDPFLRESPDVRDRVHEGHPEVSFAVIYKGMVLAAGRHTPEGQAARLRLLDPVFGGEVQKSLREFPKYARSDVIDAFVMLWTARRVANRAHVRLPAQGDKLDPIVGLKAEIVA